MTSQIGLNIEVHGVGDWDENISVNRSDFVCERFDGIAYGTNSVSVGGSLNVLPSLEDAENTNGEWVGVFRKANSGDIAIASDPFGYQLIFYTLIRDSHGTNVALASASAAGMAALLRKYQVPIEPDWTHIVGNFVSERPWTRTLGSFRTNLANVRVLSPGEALVLGKDRCGVLPSTLFETPDRPYEDLLDRGIESALKQIEAASQLPLKNREIRLSGGRDSRMILAMLVASGKAKEFRVVSVNPKTFRSKSSRPGLQRDLELSATMAKRYGMQWSTPKVGTRTRLTFNEGIEGWQSHFSNKNFELRPSSIHFMPDEWLLELRGGAGETFRGFKAVRTILNTITPSPNSTIFEQAGHLANYLYGKRNLPGTIGSDLEKRLVELFLHLGSDDFAEGLHRRFANYRNRAHFGHIRDSATKRSLTLLPLSQVDFVRARGLLSEEEQFAGVIAHDIVERLVPELNDLPFDDGPWDHSALFGRRAPSPSTWLDDPAPLLKEYNELQIQEKDVIASALIKRRNNPRFDARKEMLLRLQESLNMISELPNADRNFPISFQRTLMQKVESGSRNLNMMLAKALGITDLIFTSEFPNSYVTSPSNNQGFTAMLSALESGPARYTVD